MKCSFSDDCCVFWLARLFTAAWPWVVRGALGAWYVGSSSRLLVVVEFRLAAAGIVVAVWRDLLEEDMMFGMMNGGFVG